VKSANNDLPLTSSSEAKRTFQLDTSSQQAIQAWLVSRLSALLRIDASLIDIREPFASYGMGSTEAVSLSGELADWLGRPLSAELAYEFPTVESLAQHLAGNLGASETSASPANSGDTDTDRIAIIGIGCRMPGANSPQAFWKLLSEGVDAITEVPAQRFKVDAYYDADPASPGKINTRWGGFIDNVDRFDSHFFGISPREAARMDPQQRLLLEVTWEALEDAGAVPEQLTGTRTGVFIGISNNDYGRNQLSDLRNIDAYAGTGAVGIEALSRGAAGVVFVDDHPKSIEAIRFNLSRTKLIGTVIRDDVLRFLRRNDQRYRLVFADPPYAKKVEDRDFIGELMENKSLAAAIEPGGLLVLECSPFREFGAFRFWEITRAKKYGATKLLFCIHKDLPG